MGRKKVQILSELLDSCNNLDISPGGLLYTLAETLAIKLSDTEDAIESMITGLDPMVCAPEILVDLAASNGMYPFAQLSPIISVPFTDKIKLNTGEQVYITDDNSISATIIEITHEKIHIELDIGGQKIHNILMDHIDNNDIIIKTIAQPNDTYKPTVVFLERAGRDAETPEAFRARYLANTHASPFGGNLAYITELIYTYDSNIICTYNKPWLSHGQLLCSDIYIARPDTEGINAPAPLKQIEYTFLEDQINADCGIGVSISCTHPLIVPTPRTKLKISVNMGRGLEIPKEKIIKFAQEYCYNNIYDHKCVRLNLRDLKIYLHAKMAAFGIIDMNIVTHDNRMEITPKKDEWCIIHKDNVEFYPLI